MKISPDQIRITSLLPGSTIVNIQVLQQHPLTGTPSQTSYTDSTYISDLKTFAEDLVKKLNAGTIKVSYPILNLSYVLTGLISGSSANTTAPVPTTTTTPVTNISTNTNTSAGTVVTPSPASPTSVTSIGDALTAVTDFNNNVQKENLWFKVNPDGSIEIGTNLKIILITLGVLIFVGALILIIVWVVKGNQVKQVLGENAEVGKNIEKKKAVSFGSSVEIELDQNENASPRKKVPNLDGSLVNTEGSSPLKVFDTETRVGSKLNSIKSQISELNGEDVRILPRYKSEIPREFLNGPKYKT